MSGRERMLSACWHTVCAAHALQGQKVLSPTSRATFMPSGRGRLSLHVESRMWDDGVAVGGS